MFTKIWSLGFASPAANIKVKGILHDRLKDIPPAKRERHLIDILQDDDLLMPDNRLPAHAEVYDAELGIATPPIVHAVNRPRLGHTYLIVSHLEIARRASIDFAAVASVELKNVIEWTTLQNLKIIAESTAMDPHAAMRKSDNCTRAVSKALELLRDNDSERSLLKVKRKDKDGPKMEAAVYMTDDIYTGFVIDTYERMSAHSTPYHLRNSLAIKREIEDYLLRQRQEIRAVPFRANLETALKKSATVHLERTRAVVVPRAISTTKARSAIVGMSDRKLAGIVADALGMDAEQQPIVMALQEPVATAATPIQESIIMPALTPPQKPKRKRGRSASPEQTMQ